MSIGPALRRLLPSRADSAAPETVVARTNLLTRLLILVAVATVPAVLVLAYLEQNLRIDGRAHMAEDELRQAELVNADLTTVIGSARQLSLAITRFHAVQAADPDCGGNLRRLRADLPNYAAISVIGEDGAVICSTDDGLSGWADAALTAEIREVIHRGHFDIGTYMAATPTRGAMLPLSMPFATESGHQAVVRMGLSLDWLSAHLGELQQPARSTIGIADRNGLIVARFPTRSSALGGLFPLQIRPLITATHRGSALLPWPDGRERLISYVPATDSASGLFVVTGTDPASMMADLDQATLHGIVLITIGAMVSIWLALWAGQRFVRRPTAALLHAARRWSSGDLSARAELRESPRSEFGRLAMAFNDMAAALDRQRSELQELNATLEARVDQRTADLSDSRNRLQVEMAERERTEATLRQAQKLQAVGQLAGGIAHDFNNLLTAVIGALDLLRARLPAGQEGLVRLVDSALHAAQRGGKLTGQLLTFSRRQQLLPVPTDLNTTIVELSNLLGSTLGRSIRIQTDLVRDLWPAMVDPSQIEAAIINLAINARDAMPEGGVLTLASRNLTLGAGGTATPGDYVVIRVIDTGTGMEPEIIARVFEPFFTTKEPGRGSGLGLSQVHGLAVQSGGDVRIESRPGEGCTVTLLLPRARAMPAAPADPFALRVAAPRCWRVLVVDDDEIVRGMSAEMLVERGYVVEQASDATEALAILRREPGIELMLADFVMPGMNGAALIRAAREFRPGLRCLLMTGHAELRPDEAIGAEHVIRKPFTIASLDDRLARLMATPVLRAVS